jgi:hypothetical protein
MLINVERIQINPSHLSQRSEMLKMTFKVVVRLVTIPHMSKVMMRILDMRTGGTEFELLIQSL